MATYVMCGDPPIEGPVELVAVFTMDVPPSWSKTKRQQAYAQQIKPAGKPDIDNLAKTVMDAINGVVYADDAQVVMIAASKRYRTDCEAPMTTVRVIPA